MAAQRNYVPHDSRAFYDIQHEDEDYILIMVLSCTQSTKNSRVKGDFLYTAAWIEHYNAKKECSGG